MHRLILAGKAGVVVSQAAFRRFINEFAFIPANTGRGITIIDDSCRRLPRWAGADTTITVGGVQVANIRVDAALPTDPTVHPYAEGGNVDGGSQWSAVRPYYLRDLRDTAQVPVTPSDSETIRMGARSVLGSKFNNTRPI
jgi:hypothetical protein